MHADGRQKALVYLSSGSPVIADAIILSLSGDPGAAGTIEKPHIDLLQCGCNIWRIKATEG